MIKILFILFPFLYSNAIEISQSEIIKSKDKTIINIELNNKILIKNILYINDKLEMPFDEYNGKKYYDIKILSKETYLTLKKIAENRLQIKKNINKIPDYEIYNIKHLNSPVRISNIFIKINKDINLIAGLMKKKDGNLWISYPKNFLGEYTEASGKNSMSRLP